ncbi:MAG TPA: hypothetical protein VFR66_10095 [Burkholderiales bacterium]|nr:hypothetical protein [Burkholderiales bacterium]
MLRTNVLALLLAMPLAAMAQSEAQLIQRYTELAGSTENATSLVTGLREGKEVKLTEGTTTVSFTPKTEKMGYGNIDNALALAEATLGKDATPTELKSVLTGGTVDNVTYEGILNMRASGMGWGEIAQVLGFKLGEVKRSDKANPKAPGVEPVAQVERASRPEKPERPVKPERPEKPERAGKGR